MSPPGADKGGSPEEGVKGSQRPVHLHLQLPSYSLSVVYIHPNANKKRNQEPFPFLTNAFCIWGAAICFYIFLSQLRFIVISGSLNLQGLFQSGEMI